MSRLPHFPLGRDRDKRHVGRGQLLKTVFQFNVFRTLIDADHCRADNCQIAVINGLGVSVTEPVVKTRHKSADIDRRLRKSGHEHMRLGKAWQDAVACLALQQHPQLAEHVPDQSIFIFRPAVLDARLGHCLDHLFASRHIGRDHRRIGAAPVGRRGVAPIKRGIARSIEFLERIGGHRFGGDANPDISLLSHAGEIGRATEIDIQAGVERSHLNIAAKALGVARAANENARYIFSGSSDHFDAARFAGPVVGVGAARQEKFLLDISGLGHGRRRTEEGTGCGGNRNGC